MIVGAKRCGADCVKFQKSSLSDKFTKSTLERAYESPHSYGKTYGEHKRAIEFSLDQYSQLQVFCQSQGIAMTASAMDPVSVDQLVQDLKVPFVKVGSGDSNNPILLEKVARMAEMGAVVSTGMSDEDDVSRICKIFQNHRKHTNNFAILQCTSAYPTPSSDINLKYITTLKRNYPDVHVGYSGHERGYIATLGAVALGARIVERHITLDKTMKGNDHQCSLDLEEFASMVNDIRTLESALGSSAKEFQDCERPCFSKLGKSVVSAKKIKAGETLGWSHLAIKVSQPVMGFRGQDVHQLIGKVCKFDVDPDQPLSNEFFN